MRLGETTESNVRTQNAVNELWMYTGDLFDMNEVDALLIKEGVAVDLTKIKLGWDKKIIEVLDEANLTSPENQFMQKGSKAGIHTEQLSYILAEMQSLARALPDAVW